MLEDTPQPKPFRAIIVGGGLLGLTAAHIFAKTDMDYVVLEQHHDLMPKIGSLLSLMPHTFRVLDQLDALDAVSSVVTRVDQNVFMSADDATIWKAEKLAQLIETNHGHGVRIVHRPHYVEALYKSLPESAKARIHVRKRVVRIDVTDDGVTVHCADGSVEHGSIVIGADGVHSRTRQTMQSLAAGLPADTEQPSPFITTYRLLFGNLPPLQGLESGTNYECAATGVSTQILTGTKQAWLAIYEKIETPTSKRLRWTEDDKQEILKKRGHLYVAPGYTLNDVYYRCSGAVGLINLEEGLLDTWAWKRIVLVGDAVRKLEPHAGLGYNSGVSDLVELANRLQRLTREKTTSSSPIRTADLEDVFHAYQAQRMEDTPTIISMSEKRARMCAWLTTKDWFMARIIFPWLPLGEWSVKSILGPVISRAPVLDWLNEKHLPARATPYVHHPKLVTKKIVNYNDTPAPSTSRLPLLTGTIVLAAVVTVGFRLHRRL
ncbi:hypothetical protein F5B22DRAFT_642613 [Xylaria bambusicola]|uniref:uncharacterized protein n=1 Tax=Xylaria bambusicola TaxID=326684 RepID=UPI002007A356|nr:uncharacterized protein F5B22DRAFT_642613 [Xylaria bambusicola]KAI0525605.1 hypothetical protein F5B22DRAFT_642613 [Xylaria bambusicola]